MLRLRATCGTTDHAPNVEIRQPIRPNLSLSDFVELVVSVEDNFTTSIPSEKFINILRDSSLILTVN
jgi:hypothetical protein